MPLPGSGTISLQDIEDEFGGAGSISISEYYGAAAGVPGSGTISFSDFYGTSAGVIQVTSPVAASHTVSGAITSAGIVFQTDGGLDEVGPGAADFTAHNSGEYWSAEPASGIGASYDVRCASISSGSWDFAAAATGTWVNMGTQRLWRIQVTAMESPASQSITASFEIRPAGGGATLDTFTFNGFASN